jgi:hypothetical protein
LAGSTMHGAKDTADFIEGKYWGSSDHNLESYLLSQACNQSYSTRIRHQALGINIEPWPL